MINKRYMVTAERVDNGECVMGYYTGESDNGNHYIITDFYDEISCEDPNVSGYSIDFHEINPETIEPVAIEVKRGGQMTADGSVTICPNCNGGLKPRLDDYFCNTCGQRLYWGE